MAAAARSADMLVAGSEAFAGELRRLGVRPRRLRRILWGIDHATITGRCQPERVAAVLQKLRDKGCPIDDDTELFTCSARLDFRKNLDTFVRAARHLRDTHGDRKLVFLITGGDEDLGKREVDLRELLRSTAQLYGVDDIVCFGGGLSEDELPALLYASRAVVLPSVREGLGLALLEAMAVGRPAVGAAVPGVTEVIKSEKTGLLFPATDAEKLAAALGRLLDEPKLAGRLTKAAKYSIKTTFNHDRMARQHYALYRKLLGRNG
jgi:glycogen synthase